MDLEENYRIAARERLKKAKTLDIVSASCCAAVVPILIFPELVEKLILN